MAAVTVNGLTELVVTLDKAVSAMPVEVQAVLGKAGGNIKDGARRRWAGMKHLPKLPSLVSYDVYAKVGGYAVDVGPAHIGQGELANFAEFGSQNNPPRPALAPELDLEAPKAEAALAALVDRLL
jgi:hypothetical protein